MLCDVCQNKAATVHLTEIINKKVIEIHICHACAQGKTVGSNSKLNISDFLGDTNVEKIASQKLKLKCYSCGLSYSDFKKTGRLGCENCYIIFRKQLLVMLKRIHASVQHVGGAPVDMERKVSVKNLKFKIEELNESLRRAINLEEYEHAANLRGKIKNLEGKLN